MNEQELLNQQKTFSAIKLMQFISFLGLVYFFFILNILAMIVAGISLFYWTYVKRKKGKQMRGEVS